MSAASDSPAAPESPEAPVPGVRPGWWPVASVNLAALVVIAVLTAAAVLSGWALGRSMALSAPAPAEPSPASAAAAMTEACLVRHQGVAFYEADIRALTERVRQTGPPEDHAQVAADIMAWRPSGGPAPDDGCLLEVRARIWGASDPGVAETVDAVVAVCRDGDRWKAFHRPELTAADAHAACRASTGTAAA